jgi:hypothetical protein
MESAAVGGKSAHYRGWEVWCFGDTPIRLTRHGKVFVNTGSPYFSLSLRFPPFFIYSSALKIQISAILRHVKARANGSPMEFLIPGKKRSLKEMVNFT